MDSLICQWLCNLCLLSQSLFLIASFNHLHGELSRFSSVRWGRKIGINRVPIFWHWQRRRWLGEIIKQMRNEQWIYNLSARGCCPLYDYLLNVDLKCTNNGSYALFNEISLLLISSRIVGKFNQPYHFTCGLGSFLE